VVVGYNGVRVRAGADVLVEGYRLRVDARLQPSLEKSTTPVLTVWQRGAGGSARSLRTSCRTGLADPRLGRAARHAATGNEVGHLYPAFLVDLRAG